MSHLGSICSSSNDTPVLILQHLVFVFTGLYLKLINTHRILGQTYLGMAKSAPGLLHGHKLPQYHSETINIRFLIWRLTTEKFWGHPFRLKKKNNHRSYMLNDVFQMEKFWGHLQAERGKRRRERKTKCRKVPDAFQIKFNSQNTEYMTLWFITSYTEVEWWKFCRNSN